MGKDIQVVEFQGTPVRLVRIGGVNYIPAEDLGKILGFSEPQASVFKIFERHRGELEPHSTTVKLTAVDGKLRELRVFTETGAYLVAMFARTPKAKEVRLWLAELPKKFRAARDWLAEEIDELIRRVTGAAFKLGTLTLNEETLERVYLRYALSVEPAEAAKDLGLEKWKVKEAYRCLETLRVPKIQGKGKIPWTDETHRTRTAYGTSEEVMNFVDAVEEDLRKAIEEVLRISGGNYETFFKCFAKFVPCWCRVGKIRVILTKEVLKKAPPFLTLKDLANLLRWEYGPSTIKGKSFKTCYIEQRFFWERYVADLVQRMETNLSIQTYPELSCKIVKH